MFQPYIALGKGLQTAGHQVQLATLGVFEPMVRGYGLDFALFEASPLSFVERVIASSSNGVQRMLQTRRILMTMMDHLLEDAWHAVQGADLMITSNLLIYPGYTLSEQLGIPSIGTFLVPYLRTRAFPNPAFCSGRHAFGGRGNLLTYDLFHEGLWQLYRGSMNWQRQRFGLSPLPRWGMVRQILREHYPFLCAYSPLVVPRPADWGANIHVPGYWFLDAPAGWQPPDALLAFLEAGPPPVYIGLGSMKTRHPAATTALMVQALAQSGQRGISAHQLFRGQRDRDTRRGLHPDRSSPRLALSAHGCGGASWRSRNHGGRSSCRRADDHYTHLRRSVFLGPAHCQAGCWPTSPPPKHLTVEQLTAALRLATSDQAMQERARTLGQYLREEDGIAQAVRIIEAIRATPTGRLAAH